MYKHTELRLMPFYNTLYVYIGKCEDVSNITLTRFNYNLSEYAFGSVGLLSKSDTRYLMWCNSKNSLLHEITHLVDSLMKYYSVFDKEFRAYYTEYLYSYLKNDKNYKIMNKKVKKNKKK